MILSSFVAPNKPSAYFPRMICYFDCQLNHDNFTKSYLIAIYKPCWIIKNAMYDYFKETKKKLNPNRVCRQIYNKTFITQLWLLILFHINKSRKKWSALISIVVLLKHFTKFESKIIKLKK